MNYLYHIRDVVFIKVMFVVFLHLDCCVHGLLGLKVVVSVHKLVGYASQNRNGAHYILSNSIIHSDSR